MLCHDVERARIINWKRANAANQARGKNAASFVWRQFHNPTHIHVRASLKKHTDDVAKAKIIFGSVRLFVMRMSQEDSRYKDRCKRLTVNKRKGFENSWTGELHQLLQTLAFPWRKPTKHIEIWNKLNSYSTLNFRSWKGQQQKSTDKFKLRISSYLCHLACYVIVLSLEKDLTNEIQILFLKINTKKFIIIFTSSGVLYHGFTFGENLRNIVSIKLNMNHLFIFGD